MLNDLDLAIGMQGVIDAITGDSNLGRSSILTTCFFEQPGRPPRGLLGRSDWDWDLFCQLAYVHHRWPANVSNRATNLILLFRHLEADGIGNVTLPELPHHALLDAHLLADLYRRLTTGSNRGTEHG